MAIKQMEYLFDWLITMIYTWYILIYYHTHGVILMLKYLIYVAGLVESSNTFWSFEDVSSLFFWSFLFAFLRHFPTKIANVRFFWILIPFLVPWVRPRWEFSGVRQMTVESDKTMKNHHHSYNPPINHDSQLFWTWDLRLLFFWQL
jgi:hypothetical protein